MRNAYAILLWIAIVATALVARNASAAGNPDSGARVFRACAACHSLEAGHHMTGPSLANIVGRKAGTVEGFSRYSPALKSSNVVWDEAALDAWLKNPQALVQGNRMPFAGIQDAQARADLIAYLERTSSSGTGQSTPQPTTGMGMMRAPEPENLKALPSDQQVAAIRHCGDSYYVTTVSGETLPFWEFNLRFKTDSSDKGPQKEHPALVRAGMMGDRASIIFADPADISAAIERRCE
jgi:cytochrome c